MIERIKKLCDLRQTNFSQVEKSLDFANGSLRKSRPETIQAVRLKALADFFNVSMEYILTGEKPAASMDLTSEEKAIVIAYRSKSDEVKSTIAGALGVKRQDTCSELSSKVG